MDIGELARAINASAEPIWHQDRIGGARWPPRTMGAGRNYAASHVRRLILGRPKRLASTAPTGMLPDPSDETARSCKTADVIARVHLAAVKHPAVTHLATVKRRLADLAARREPASPVARCRHGLMAGRRIIEPLAPAPVPPAWVRSWTD